MDTDDNKQESSIKNQESGDEAELAKTEKEGLEASEDVSSDEVSSVQSETTSPASADQSLSEPGESDESAHESQAKDEVLVSEVEGATTDADSQLSEEGEVRPESTSSDVHEEDRASSEQSEESELENQDTSSDQNDQDIEEQPQEDTPQPAPAEPTPGKWYVVHTFAGHENKVAQALKQRIEAEHLESKIFDILVPTQDKIEIRAGKKETVKEKIFPGYILVKMELDDVSWLAVRTTPGVTSFVGMSNKPTPVSEAEIASIVKFTTQGAAPTFKDVFMVDDTVKIIDGPFAEFIGKVESVDKEKGRVRVLVSIFGRETPVELDFLQVTKL